VGYFALEEGTSKEGGFGPADSKYSRTRQYCMSQSGCTLWLMADFAHSFTFGLLESTLQNWHTGAEKRNLSRKRPMNGLSVRSTTVECAPTYTDVTSTIA
jgi:hypothetical protein